MDQATYQQLLKESPSFNELDNREQELIFNAAETDREYYIRIYSDEKRLLADSENLYRTEVKNIVFNYKFEHQQEVKENLKTQESATAASDQEDAEKLLNQL